MTRYYPSFTLRAWTVAMPRRRRERRRAFDAITIKKGALSKRWAVGGAVQWPEGDYCLLAVGGSWCLLGLGGSTRPEPVFEES